MELFWYHVTEMDDKTYDTAFAMLASDRKKRVKDMPSEADQKRTVAAEYLARTVLGEKLGVEPKNVPLTVDENDKPVLAGGAYHVSVSHSGPWAVCAIDDKPLGVDVEVVRVAQEKFIYRVCDEKEVAYIRLGDEGCYHRFYECWTAKEALFKLTGKGPLLSLSRYDLRSNTALVYTFQNGCAVTVATTL